MRDSQLLLIPGQPSRTPRAAAALPARLRIDERTRSLGLEGIAAARAVLREIARARAEEPALATAGSEQGAVAA
jgi:hypothetical protein